MRASLLGQQGRQHVDVGAATAHQQQVGSSATSPLRFKCSYVRYATLLEAHAAATACRPHAGSKSAVSDEQIAIKRRAKSARLSGDSQLAFSILLQGVQQYPHDYHLVAAAASAAAKLGDSAQSLQILNPALQEQPHNVHLLTAAAAAYVSSSKHEAARNCYQAAAAVQPHNAVVLQAWGILEASCGDVETAVRLFKQAAAADPAHVPVYVAWARVEAERSHVKLARQLHQQGHQQDPRHVPNLHAWAGLESSEGQWLAAVKLLEQALAVDKHHMPSWMALGKAHWALGDSATCRRVYQAACKSLGPKPELLNQWATLEQQAHRLQAARAVLGFLDTVLQQQQQPQPTSQQQQRQQGQDEKLQLMEEQQRQGQRSGMPQQQKDVAQQGQYSDPRLQQLTAQQLNNRQLGKQQAAAQQAGSHQHKQQPAEPPDTGQQHQRQTQHPTQAEAVQAIEASSPVANMNTLVDQQGSLCNCQPVRWQQQLDEMIEHLNSMKPATLSAASAPAVAYYQQQVGAGHQVGRQQQHQQQHVRQKLQEQQRQQALAPAAGTVAGSGSKISSTIGSLVVLPATPQGLQQHVPSLVSAAAMEHRAGNAAKAIKLYKAALQLDPTNPKLLHQLVQMHLKRGERAVAEEYLQMLEQAHPGNGFLCHSRGLLAQQEGQLAEAREWFTRGLQAKGNEPALINYEALAELQVFLGDVSAARATLAAGLTSRRPTARFMRMAGLVEKRLGDLEAATRLLSRAVALAPRDYRSWLAWAVLERHCKHYSAAARCFQRGTACAPGNPHIWYVWATMTWKDLQDHRAARRLFEQATTCCPRSAPLWMEWAMLEWDTAGNPDRARELFRKGADVPRSYQHPPLYQAWAQREAAAGNTVKAKQVSQRALQLSKNARQGSNRPSGANKDAKA